MKNVLEGVKSMLSFKSSADAKAQRVIDEVDGARTNYFRGALRAQGLNSPDTFDIATPTVEALQAVLDQAYNGRPSNFSASEMVSNGQMPPVRWWPRVAFLRWVADELREDEPIKIKHMYRPADFNKAVGGAPESAHIHCCALDIHFRSLRAWQIAMRKLHHLYNSPIHYGLGLGVGHNMVHVDFFSTTYSRIGKPRWWTYPTAPSQYEGPGSLKGVD